MDDETSGDRVKAEQLAQVDASEGGETAKKFPSFFQNSTFALACLLFEVASPTLKPGKRISISASARQTSDPFLQPKLTLNLPFLLAVASY